MSSKVKTLEQLENELRRRQREDPLGLVYTPHEIQERIHRSRKPITLVVGGNRTGKSYSAVAEALYYSMGRRVHAEVPKPPNVVWYTMPSLTQFRRSIRPTFKELCPPEEWARYRKREHMLPFSNGSELWFVSSDMRQRRLQGASVDFAIMDEAQPEEVFEEIQARVMDRRGRILIVLTPVDEDVSKWLWIRDKLYLPWRTGERKDVDVIHMPIADEQGRSLVPHFTDEDIQRMLEQWPDPQVRAVRMYGEFIVRSGLVFSGFDPDIHLIPRFEIPDHYTKWLVCDPQYHRFAVLFFAADNQGRYFVTNEYFSVDQHHSIRAARIKAMLGPQERDIPMYVDSANPQDIAEMNYHFQRIGAPIGAIPIPMQKRVDRMILRAQSMMEPDENREYPKDAGMKGIYGSPRLLFFNDLKSSWEKNNRPVQASRLFYELRRLTWGNKDKPNKDSADGADCIDCLVYGCSIMASGAAPQDKDAWKQGLDPADVMIWEAIERQDRTEKKRLEEWS